MTSVDRCLLAAGPDCAISSKSGQERMGSEQGPARLQTVTHNELHWKRCLGLGILGCNRCSYMKVVVEVQNVHCICTLLDVGDIQLNQHVARLLDICAMPATNSKVARAPARCAAAAPHAHGAGSACRLDASNSFVDLHQCNLRMLATPCCTKEGSAAICQSLNGDKHDI